MAVAIPAVPLVRGSGRRVLSLPQSRSTVFNWIGFSLVIVVTLIVIAVPLLAPYDPLLPVGMPLQAPGKNGFLLGTDSVGRDIFTRVLYGARSSWFAALVVVAVGLLIGGLVGLIAGTTGGWVDTVLMRITDGFLSLPAPVLAGGCAAKSPGWRPARTSRRRNSLGSADFGSQAVTCCPVPCPTRWWPPASTSAR